MYIGSLKKNQFNLKKWLKNLFTRMQFRILRKKEKKIALQK